MKPSLALAALLVTSAITGASAACAGTLESRVVPGAVARGSAAFAGRLDPATPMRVEIVLPMRNPGGLRSLLDDQIYNPKSVLFRRYLSVAEFTQRFGPSQYDYSAAIAFFRDNGLAVTHTFANRYMFEVAGTASDIERVLHINLNLYKHPDENRDFVAPDREPALALDVPVLSISGLDTFQLPVPRLMRSPDGARAGTGSGPNGNFIGSDFRAAYYGKGANARLTGKGQSVGLMELAGYIPSDIPLYFRTFHQPLKVPVNGISVDGTKVDCGHCNDGEQTLDIDYAISMAPRLDQVQVYVAKNPVAIEEQMASDDTSKTLSTSWGYAKDFAVEDPIYQEMAAQGQSWFTASGDAKTLRKSFPWPEEDANIIAVGGTDLVTGAGGSWKSEPGWQYSASGPSLDKHIGIERYQLPYINAKNGGSKTLRNVSDVSANADFDMIICARGKCNGGWGGTSFSSPMWAGFAALANEKASGDGKSTVGFINPILYRAYASHPKMTHDIIRHRSGDYRAVRGYDLVGGLGSPNGDKTIRILLGN
jgi:subtilase family serine protease